MLRNKPMVAETHHEWILENNLDERFARMKIDESNSNKTISNSRIIYQKNPKRIRLGFFFLGQEKSRAVSYSVNYFANREG